MRKNRYNSSGGLISLAALTGGLYLHNRNDLAEAVRQTVDDAEGYYLIGYHPDSDAFLSKGKEGATCRTMHFEDKERHSRGARRGCLNSSGRDDQTTAAVRDANSCAPCGHHLRPVIFVLRLTPLFGNSPGGTSVQAMLFVDPADLKFVETAAGEHQAVEIDLAAVSLTATGESPMQWTGTILFGFRCRFPRA